MTTTDKLLDRAEKLLDEHRERSCQSADHWDTKVRLIAAIDAWKRDKVALKEISKYPLQVAFCHSGTDGDCNWAKCPQLRDGEPVKSGRRCPLDTHD